MKKGAPAAENHRWAPLPVTDPSALTGRHSISRVKKHESGHGFVAPKRT
jgi:hypothetical protein